MVNLTYKEQYDIPLKIVVDEFKCEYAGCGSHKMELNVVMDLEEIISLHTKIKELKGITSLEEIK